jgi:hypothetical protein
MCHRAVELAETCNTSESLGVLNLDIRFRLSQATWDLTKLKALKETQTPSKDTPPNIIAVRLAGNLESQSSIPPKRCYEVGIRKTQLKSNNVQQISNTISTISNNKTTSRVRLKDLSWSPSRFGRLPFQRRHAGRSANPAATTAKTLGID